MNWITLSVICTALWGLSNVLNKIIRQKYIKNSYNALIALMAFEAIALLFIPFIGFRLLPWNITILAFISGALFVIGVLLFIEALAVEESSRIIPLWNFVPLFVIVIAAVFLNEKLLLRHYIAFILLVAGGFVISLKRIHGAMSLSKGFFLMIISSIIIAIEEVLDKYLFANYEFWNMFMWIKIGTVLTAVLLIPIKGKSFSLFRDIEKKTVFTLLILNSLLSLLAYIAFAKALLGGPVSIVSAILAVQPLFILVYVFILSMWLPRVLKEDIGRDALLAKCAAIALMIAGVWVMYL